MTKKYPIYLDYAATTPVDPRVALKMSECLTLTGIFGNPASSHEFGLAAKAAVEKAREQVASLIRTVSRNIIFTSGATEANNLALKGVAEFYQTKGKHIISTKTEHPAVLDTCAFLKERGFSVTYLTPEKNGVISEAELQSALRPDTILVSIMQVNNETGVFQDIAKLGMIIRKSGAFLHVDAAQSLGKIPLDVSELPVDLMSFSGHKIYGPKGIGALFINDTPRVRLLPQLHGGAQERKMRAGTLATHQIVGMGEACALLKENLETERAHIQHCRDRFWQGIRDLPEVYLNSDAAYSIPNILNVRFQGKPKESFFKQLTEVAASMASACNSIAVEPSYVLRAMGLTDEEADRSVRFSFGRFTEEAEIDLAITSIRKQYLKTGEVS